MMIAIHWRIQKLIEYYLLGALSPSERSAFESHIAQCAQCRQKLEKEKGFHRQISSTKQILDKSWNRTYARLMELPPPAGPIPGLANPRSKKSRLHWPIQDWNFATMTSKVVAVIALFAIIWVYLTIPRMTPLQLTQQLGNGMWRKSVNTSEWERVNGNTRLQPGDQIRTDEFCKGLIRLGKVGQVWINNSSELRFMTSSTTELEITRGEVFVSLTHFHNEFQVNTPGGLVKVFGTEFMIAVDSVKKTTVSCLQNNVYFNNTLGNVILSPGYQSFANASIKPSIPEAVDTLSLIVWKNQFDQFVRLPVSEKKKLHESYVEHGDRLYDHKQYADALKTYVMAAYLDPSDYSPFYGIGRSYRAMGDYGMATVTYLRALERNKDANAIYYQLSMALVDLKQFSEAEKYLFTLITKRSSNHTEWVLMGNCFLLEGNYAKAQEMYEQALRRGAELCDECNPQIHGGLAEIARQKGDLKTAQAELKKALQYSSPAPIVYLESAWLYKDLGNIPQERFALENYLKLTPYGEYARDARNRLTQLGQPNYRMMEEL